MKYLFEIDLLPIDEDLTDVMNEQMHYLHPLFESGSIPFFSLSATKDHLWCVVLADDERSAMDVVSAFPLRKFFADVSCNLLGYFHAQLQPIPALSLN